ncbi:MAG: beta-N-acetylhexosaminidase [Myxococcales bacterium]
MDFDALAARCVIVGIQGLVPTVDELELIGRGVGGVILFKRNVESPQQLAELSRTLKAAAKAPLLVSIDQEGGRVQRLRAPYWTDLPSMRRIGEIDVQGGIGGMNGVAIAERLGRLVAQELSACGIDHDYAPILDVDTNPNNPVIADRSFGRDPARVARLGVAFAKGLEAGSVASCAKHFPGHGDTSQDSHKVLPRLAHDRERLWQVELVPFVAAARAGLASVMTAHVRFEAFDRLPATLSPLSLQILRRDVGYQGACISDDLEMKAIADTYGVVDGAELAISAGCDGGARLPYPRAPAPGDRWHRARRQGRSASTRAAGRGGRADVEAAAVRPPLVRDPSRGGGTGLRHRGEPRIRGDAPGEHRDRGRRTPPRSDRMARRLRPGPTGG